MPQQINLCTPILLTQKRYFSALTMLQALALIVVVGGGITAYWVWSLKQATAGFRQTLASTTVEMATLKAAIQSRKAAALPLDPALVQELKTRRLEEARRENVLVELRRGLFKPGWGQSARMQLIAQTIPPEVWVTQVLADDTQINVSGFTLEPAALNEWVRKLSGSPLLQGQSLATIKVERVVAEGTAGAVAAAAVSGLNSATGLSNIVNGAGVSQGSVVGAAVTTVAAAKKPVWSFNLVTAVATPIAVPAAIPVVDASKVKP